MSFAKSNPSSPRRADHATPAAVQAAQAFCVLELFGQGVLMTAPSQPDPELLWIDQELPSEAKQHFRINQRLVVLLDAPSQIDWSLFLECVHAKKLQLRSVGGVLGRCVSLHKNFSIAEV
jgi:hypothetical protein